MILRYTAFTDSPDGGNPAGVVLDATGMSAERDARDRRRPRLLRDRVRRRRERTATTTSATSAPRPRCRSAGTRRSRPASRSPSATAPGRAVFHTQAGEVPVDTSGNGRHGDAHERRPARRGGARGTARRRADRARAGRATNSTRQLPPRIGFAGARHLILAAATRERLADLDYDFDALKQSMLAHDLTTVDLVHREDAHTFRARNPFPVGGVVEDPATGAAAAAFGAYLRELGLVTPPATVTVHQGVDMGRPSLLTIEIDAERPEIRVSGRAVAM